MSWQLRLDQAPWGWRRTQLRSFLTRSRKRGQPDLPLLSVNLPDGVVPRQEGDGRPAPAEDLSAYQVVHRGDLVMNQLGKPHGALGVSQFDGIISPAYFVARIGDSAEPRFVHHLLRTGRYISEYERRGKYMPPSQFDISWEQFRAIPVALPPLWEQRAIADFLDTETARIDALITKKRRVIDLLEVRFGTYIRKRLAQVGPVLPLKRRWNVVDCKHRTPEYLDGGYPVMSPGDVTPGRLDLNRAHRFVGQTDYDDLADVLRRPRQGDIIYSRNASIGIASYVDTEVPFCMGQDVCLITSRDQDQLYLTYVLNSIGVDQLDVQKIGSTFSRVNIAQVVNLNVPTPEPPVQHRLAREFDETRTQHDRAAQQLRKQLALLREHRQALITAAVMGELDVPGVAA